MIRISVKQISLIIVMIIIASCHTYKGQHSVYTNTENTDTVKNDDFYTVIQKVYKTKTGQGYTRITERNYFGLQNEAPSTFKKYDVKKGINIAEYKKYPTASFFASGVFTIPDDKKQQAYKLFIPIIDSVFKSQTNSEFLRAEIVIVGYTDETPFTTSSETYKTIASLLNQSMITQIEYNNYLSFMRAKEIYDIITEIHSDKIDELKFFSKSLIDITAEGRGIEYPDASKKYKLIDDKRRITKVYWKVFN